MFRRSSRAHTGASTSPPPDAFAEEVLALLDPLYATALRLTRNRSDAEDLVQDTFVKAFRFSDRYTRGTNLKAWVYTILHNTWRNRIRDASRNTVDVDSDAVEAAASLPTGPAAFDTPERILLRGTLDADLQAALDQLPPAFREAVWLRDVEEFTYAEIAAMLEVPIGTVMSRISRGRRLLFEQLSRAGLGARVDEPASKVEGRRSTVEKVQPA